MRRGLLSAAAALSLCPVAALGTPPADFELQVEQASRSIFSGQPARLPDAPGSSVAVVGGTEAEKGEFPFIVSLWLGGRQVCGGSLVAKNWVLTASHCTPWILSRYIRVVAGTQDLRDLSGAESFGVAKVVRHPKAWFPSYDFALLKLDGESKFPPIGLNRAEPRGDVDLVVAGWGCTVDGDRSSKSQILRKATLPLVPRERCAESYALEGGKIDDSMLCAGPQGDGKRHSKGDSGGPLVMGEAAQRTLTGVVSWHSEGNYSVYADVSKAAPWIDSVIGTPAD